MSTVPLANNETSITRLLNNNFCKTEITFIHENDLNRSFFFNLKMYIYE